jgi:hypothetical protein
VTHDWRSNNETIGKRPPHLFRFLIALGTCKRWVQPKVHAGRKGFRVYKYSPVRLCIVKCLWHAPTNTRLAHAVERRKRTPNTPPAQYCLETLRCGISEGMWAHGPFPILFHSRCNDRNFYRKDGPSWDDVSHLWDGKEFSRAEVRDHFLNLSLKLLGPGRLAALSLSSLSLHARISM